MEKYDRFLYRRVHSKAMTNANRFPGHTVPVGVVIYSPKCKNQCVQKPLLQLVKNRG